MKKTVITSVIILLSITLFAQKKPVSYRIKCLPGVPKSWKIPIEKKTYKEGENTVKTQTGKDIIIAIKGGDITLFEKSGGKRKYLGQSGTSQKPINPDGSNLDCNSFSPSGCSSECKKLLQKDKDGNYTSDSRQKCRDCEDDCSMTASVCKKFPARTVLIQSSIPKPVTVKKE